MRRFRLSGGDARKEAFSSSCTYALNHVFKGNHDKSSKRVDFYNTGGLFSAVLRIYALVLCIFLAGNCWAYSVYVPQDGAMESEAFNVVVKMDGDSNPKPGRLEISGCEDFAEISFFTDSWRLDTGWWVASVPTGVLGSGTNYWRIKGNEQVVHHFTADGQLVKPESIKRDTEVLVIPGADGKLYTLTNMWMRNQDLENGLGETVNFTGRASAGMTVYDNKIFIPKWRTEYETESHLFSTYNLETGTDLGDFELPTLKPTTITETNPNYYYYKRRRYEEIGVDDAGNLWIASPFNVREIGHSRYYSSNPYFKDILKHKQEDNTSSGVSDQYVLIRVMNYEKLVVNRTIRLMLPDKGCPFCSYNDWMFTIGNIQVKGDLKSNNYSIYATVFGGSNQKNSDDYSIIRWTKTADTGNDLSNPEYFMDAYKVKNGRHSQLYFFDDNHFLTNCSDPNTEDTAKAINPAYYEMNETTGEIKRKFWLPILNDDYQNLSAKSEELAAKMSANSSYQKPQTGSMIHGFKMGDNTFVIQSYTMQPLLQFAIRHVNLTPQSRATTAELTAADMPIVAKFPTEPMNNIYEQRGTGSTGIGKIVTVPDGNSMDIYIYAPPHTLAKYRMSPVIPTSVPDLTSDNISTGYLRLENRIVYSDTPDATIRVCDLTGHTVATSTAKVDLTQLPVGLYIATAPGHTPLKIVLK